MFKNINFDLIFMIVLSVMLFTPATWFAVENAALEDVSVKGSYESAMQVRAHRECAKVRSENQLGLREKDVYVLYGAYAGKRTLHMEWGKQHQPHPEFCSTEDVAGRTCMVGLTTYVLTRCYITR